MMAITQGPAIAMVEVPLAAAVLMPEHEGWPRTSRVPGEIKQYGADLAVGDGKAGTVPLEFLGVEPVRRGRC